MAEMRGLALDLLWSAWSELGIPGAVRRHRAVAIDPEPLIVFTPLIASEDPRLLGLVFDWCCCHAGRISKTRLLALARRAPEPVREAFSQLNASLRHEGISWMPVSGNESLKLQRDREVVALPLRRPSMARLRMRAVAGVSIRAEVCAGLLALGERADTVDRIAPVGVSRRSAERVLADLAAAGTVIVGGAKRGRRFRFRELAAWQTVAGDDGSLSWWDWFAVLSMVHELMALEEVAGLPDGLRRVEVVRRADILREHARGCGLSEPPTLEGRKDAFDALMAWGERLLESLVHPDSDGISAL